jgi:small subunit ribosomal protein S15
MSLDKELKTEILTKYQHHPKDTGSAEVQVALLTQRINELNEHLQEHKKDNSSRRGLLLLVGRRRKFLGYLQKRSYGKYQELIQALGLRK